MISPAQVQLLPAEHDDAPRINEIAWAAFANDKQTLYKLHETGSTEISSELDGDFIYMHLKAAARGECVVLKAVDEESSQIAGFAVWYFWNYDGSKPVVSR
jgi:hypothetical protein